MDRGAAEALIEVLNNRIRIPDDKKENLIEILEDTPVHNRGFHLQNRFSVNIHHNEHPVIIERARYISLSLRRVLINRLAGLIYLGEMERAMHNVTNKLKIGYSSTEKASRIMDNSELLRMMGQSRAQFSLLGKLRIHDYDNPEERLYVVSKPMLVIPGADNIEEIQKWEESQAHYRKEVGLFFRHQKRIKAEDYVKAAQN